MLFESSRRRYVRIVLLPVECSRLFGTLLIVPLLYYLNSAKDCPLAVKVIIFTIFSTLLDVCHVLLFICYVLRLLNCGRYLLCEEGSSLNIILMLYLLHFSS